VICDSIQIFGVDRVIHGSNFPLEKLHARYADLVDVYRKVMSEHPDADQRKVFHDNSVKFCRL
jgi:predicted TIM-barrel fold metal-dependent hydrolase